MTRAVHVPYTVEAAVADLRDALEALIAEFGVPDELTLLIDVA